MTDITGQMDLFIHNPTQNELDSFIGMESWYNYDLGKPFYVKYLTAPQWDDINQRWTCLANVEGMLCIIEVKITED